VVAVAFLGSPARQQDRKNFNNVAERWRAHYSFGSVDALDGHSTQPSIAVYTQEEDDPVYYRGPFNVDDINTFLQNATTPLIREHDPVIYEQAIAVSHPYLTHSSH
jgi:protein disulfide-isomerase A1